jgi:hypothetical protein
MQFSEQKKVIFGWETLQASRQSFQINTSREHFDDNRLQIDMGNSESFIFNFHRLWINKGGEKLNFWTIEKISSISFFSQRMQNLFKWNGKLDQRGWMGNLISIFGKYFQQILIIYRVHTPLQCYDKSYKW